MCIMFSMVINAVFLVSINVVIVVLYNTYTYVHIDTEPDSIDLVQYH